MMEHKPVYIIFLSLCVIMTGYFFLSAPREVGSRGGDADDLMALMGGGEPEDNDGSYLDTTHEGSFLDNRTFFEAGLGEQGGWQDEEEYANRLDEEDPEILEPANPNNPKNPMTGEPYSDAAMSAFGRLRERFPNNDLIPRRKSEDELKAENDHRTQMYAINTLIAQGKADEDQVNQYYDWQMKSFADRQELLDYVLEEKGDAMSEDIKEQYQKIKDVNDQQIKQLELQRERALERLGF